MLRIVVLISGNGSNLQAIIDAITAEHISGQIVAVLSNEPQAYGLTRAANAGVATEVVNHRNYVSREEYDSALLRQIDAYQPDLIVLAGFMRIFTPFFVSHYAGRMLNVHPSLLPKYKGLNTHQRALDANETEHGASVHFVTPDLDGGPVVAQAIVRIQAADDAVSLMQKVQQQERILYPKVIGWFCHSRVQMHNGQVLFDGAPLAQPFQFAS